MLESMGISQQHTFMQQDVVLPTRGELAQRVVVLLRRRSRTQIFSYRSKLFVGDPSRLVAIGRV